MDYSLSLGLFNPHHCPSYFLTPALFIWWGDPVRWEIATLVVAAICVLALALPFHTAHRRFFLTVIISGPLVFGLASSVIQINMLLHEVASAGWAGPTSPEEFIFCELFSSHIGLYCSVALFFLWACASAFHRAKKLLWFSLDANARD